MCVGAVVVAAIAAHLKYFREIMAHLDSFKIYCAEPLHSRGVNYVTALRQRNHFRKCGRVHSRVMYVRYVTGAQIDVGQYVIDK